MTSDLIRLSLPTDAAHSRIVEVAVGEVARRAGFTDAEVAAARTAVAGAFTEVTRRHAAGDAGATEVAVEIEIHPRVLTVRVACGPTERTLRLP